VLGLDAMHSHTATKD